MLPILDYDDEVYKSSSKTLLHKLDVIEHAAIQFLTGASFKTPLQSVLLEKLPISFLQKNLLVPVHLENSHWKNSVTCSHFLLFISQIAV